MLPLSKKIIKKFRVIAPRKGDTIGEWCNVLSTTFGGCGLNVRVYKLG